MTILQEITAVHGGSKLPNSKPLMDQSCLLQTASYLQEAKKSEKESLLPVHQAIPDVLTSQLTKMEKKIFLKLLRWQSSVSLL